MNEHSGGPMLLEVHHVARRLNFSHETVRKMLVSHQLAGFKVGPGCGRWRIERAELESYLQAHKTGGPA